MGPTRDALDGSVQDGRVVGTRIYFAFGCQEAGKVQTRGNPAAVVLLRDHISSAERQTMAQTLEAPMTAFVRRRGVSAAYEVSYFSASGDEFQVCGHASVAAARGIADRFGDRQAELLLARPFPSTSSVVIRVDASGHRVSMTLPSATTSKCDDIDIARQVAALAHIDVGAIREVVFSSVGDLHIPLKTPEALLGINLDEAPAAEWTRHLGLRGLLFSCPSRRLTHEIETRAFFPAFGIYEDVACGSANCTVVPYWVAQNVGLGSVLRVGYPAAQPHGSLGGEMVVTMDAVASTITIEGLVLPG